MSGAAVILLALWSLVGGSVLCDIGILIHPCHSCERRECESEEDHEDPVCDNQVILSRPLLRVLGVNPGDVAPSGGLGATFVSSRSREVRLHLLPLTRLRKLPYHPSDRPLLS